MKSNQKKEAKSLNLKIQSAKTKQNQSIINQHPLQTTSINNHFNHSRENYQIQNQNYLHNVSRSSNPVQFPVYSSVLDIRMPNADRPNSFNRVRQNRNLSYTSQSEIRRKVDSNHPFQILQHQPTDLSDRQSIYSNRQQAIDRHKRSARQARSNPNHPLKLILFCQPNSPTSNRLSLSIPLTQRVSQYDPKLNQISNNSSEMNPSTHPTKRKIYLPLQTLISFGLLVAIPSLFIYSTCANLIHHQRIIGPIILSIFSYIWLIALASMVKTVISDPGFLPRSLDPNPDMQWKPANVDAHSAEDVQQATSTPIPSTKHNNQQQQPEEKNSTLEVGEWELLPRWIKVETFKSSPLNRNRLDSDKLDHSLGLTHGQHAGWVQSKWCTSCEIYRPPRSSHCRVCDCCIDGIDHHCSYLNNCIGSRNYRSFFVFLLTSSIDLIIMIACSIWKLFFLKLPSNNDDSSQSLTVLNSLKSHPIDIVIISFSILIFIPIIALTGYHIFLTCNGLTTIEYIKARTTKKVIKENAQFVDQFYSNEEPHQGESEHVTHEEIKSSLGTRLLNKLKRNGKSTGHPNSRTPNTKSTGQDQRQQQQRSNNFVIGRLCRPDTEAFIDWNTLI